MVGMVCLLSADYTDSRRLFIRNYPLALSFPRRRESSNNNSPRSGQNLIVVPLRGNFSIDWIPACAGMTHWFSIKKSEVVGAK
jgi:hypothetical protein